MSDTPEIVDLSTESARREAEAEQKYQKATLKFDAGDLDEALMLMRTSLSLCPGSWKYHYNIAYLYWRKDLLEIAVNHYKLFLKYAPQQDPDRETIAGRIKWLEAEIKERRKLK